MILLKEPTNQVQSHWHVPEPLVKKGRKTDTQARLLFVTQYSTEARQINRIIQDNWAIVNSDPALQQVFPEPPLISYIRAPSLRDKLVHSYLPPEKKESWLKRPIGVYRCMNCPTVIMFSLC